MVTDRRGPCQPFARDEGRSVFGTVASIYAPGRPDYPERVFEILRDRCGLGPSRRVVDIGAGTGQATQRLLEAGAPVVAVESSQAVAEELRRRLGPAPDLEVVVSAFEDADLPTSSFDLVTAGTSYHWLDRDLALPKIVGILRLGGWLALWWNVFGDPNAPDPYHDATEAILRDATPSTFAGPNPPFAMDVEARTAELGEHGFRDIEYEAIRWTLTLDAAGTRRLYATYSNIARLPDADRERILDELERVANLEFGGRVERLMVTPVYTARSGDSLRR